MRKFSYKQFILRQIFPEKSFSLKNQTNSETGTSSSEAEIESVTSLNNCVTRNELKNIKSLSRRYHEMTEVCCFYTFKIEKKTVKTKVIYSNKSIYIYKLLALVQLFFTKK